MLFKNAKWIWINESNNKDEYAEFYTSANFPEIKNTLFRISCDSDYTLFVNGKYVASNQYGDYEHYKVYDEIDITEHLLPGENTFSVLVWHFGENSSRYKAAMPGVIFEAVSGENALFYSNSATPSRKSPSYESGRCGVITRQLGYGFHYDSTKEDFAIFTGEGFEKSKIVNKKCTFYPRIAKKMVVSDEIKCASLTENNNGRYHLIDLGAETVGLLSFKFTSATVQKIRIDWGEDLENGHVRRIIDARDFSVEYTAKKGENDYTNYMLRFGARYLEIYSPEPISIEKAGLIPTYYSVKPSPAKLENELDQRIYNLCLDTLKLCMMEHYVDCPWREQALYVFDSRNQMLTGYYAFDGGNKEYVYSNLKLIEMSRRDDKLLPICYPCGTTLVIPSFALHYFTSVREYFDYSGDKGFLFDVFPKLEELIEVFKANKSNGLVCKFNGADYWNFYDWKPLLQGNIGNIDEKVPDSVINLLYILALQNFEKICKAINKPFIYSKELSEIKTLTKAVFFNKDDGLYSFTPNAKDYTSLANSLAIIAGLASEDEAKIIANHIAEEKILPCTLSFKSFEYDALLLADADKYKYVIINKIRENYKYMLDMGATSAWETILGAKDFDNAGSLCHGWSAIPIYYYHKLGYVK